MINFDSLPTEKPLMGVQPGTYYGVIEKAEMKAPKDPSKPMYLNIMYGLTTKEGAPAGKLFDIITESEAAIARFKLMRFIAALEIPMTVNFELRDLAKIIVGKKLILDVCKDDKSDKPRAIVDVFKGLIYYSVKDITGAFGIPEDEAKENLINAMDAADATQANQNGPIEY